MKAIEKKVTVNLSWPVQCYLHELTRTGLYGATIEEAAATLILDGLKRTVSEKILRSLAFPH